MSELERQRRFFAEELEAICRLRSTALVDAFASVPRERFLPPGPWTVLADADFSMMVAAVPGKGPAAAAGGGMRTRLTPDADPRRVYHNIGVAIDPARQLFNGQPGTLAIWLDALDLAKGGRVLHVGCGLGYYTAVIGECVGPTGRVVAFDVDEALASTARANLSAFPWVDARFGDASQPIDGSFDAILINAGVTHPLDGWLDALAPGGRMMLPLTATMPALGSNLGKGLMMMVTKQDGDELAARVFTVVALYSAVGLRDESLNERVGKALMGGPTQWQTVRHLRRDAHEPSASCWLHGPTCCWSTA
jgi:protein-L-isoaspartate(D-aspartate) O-methyltransferase